MLFPAEGAEFWPLISMAAVLGGTMRVPFTFAVRKRKKQMKAQPAPLHIELPSNRMRRKPAVEQTVAESEYRALAEFRRHIRRYLDVSDQAAKAAGIEPQQYQLLLAIKGLPEGTDSTVGNLALQLQLRHHSTVELINRAEMNGFIRRSRSGTYVFVGLTKEGERVLKAVVQTRLEDLRTAGPALVNALQRLIKKERRRKKTEIVGVGKPA
jgi:DNA-binding MarR family transcriptional regulator